MVCSVSAAAPLSKAWIASASGAQASRKGERVTVERGGEIYRPKLGHGVIMGDERQITRHGKPPAAVARRTPAAISVEAQRMAVGGKASAKSAKAAR